MTLVLWLSCNEIAAESQLRFGPTLIILPAVSAHLLMSCCRGKWDLWYRNTDIKSHSFREIKFWCFFQTVINMMRSEVLDLPAYQIAVLSFGEIVMLYLGICCLVHGTQVMEYHKMNPDMTNSTSLTCSSLNYRSSIESAVRCTDDLQCRAVLSSWEIGGESHLALCNCMAEPAYGYVVNGHSNLDVKTDGKFVTGELLLYVD